MKRSLLAISFIFITPQVYAECTFKTGDFIAEMNDPSNVELIEIEVPNSAKYARNQFKIITSKSANIPPKLKKPFKANIDVHYPFGRCSFTGR